MVDVDFFKFVKRLGIQEPETKIDIGQRKKIKGCWTL
jgi:hypothetical protein